MTGRRGRSVVPVTLRVLPSTVLPATLASRDVRNARDQPALQAELDVWALRLADDQVDRILCRHVVVQPYD